MNAGDQGRTWRLAALVGAAAIGLMPPLGAADPLAWLGNPAPIAPGVDLFQSTDASLVETAGPIAVSILRLDPARVRLSTALARAGEVDGLDTLGHIAAAAGAVAAVNGGLFNAGNDEPVGVLKVGGELVSDSATLEGVAAIHAPARGRTSVEFDEASVGESAAFDAGGRSHTIAIDGVDTTRARGRLMLYTPMYHADTDTAPTGTDWPLDGWPLRVVGVRVQQGRTPIPRAGAVLSYGGTDLPADLEPLAAGVRVTLRTHWTTTFGLSAARLDSAESVVGGAGLLRAKSRVPGDWPATQGLGGQVFVNARHPRTIIGTDRGGLVWIAAIDGRDPNRSIGMTFADLERLCDRLGLTSALNLDGGSSTGMIVRGTLVNRPVNGQVHVNNAIVVLERQ
jgi:hypothetical protein